MAGELINNTYHQDERLILRRRNRAIANDNEDRDHIVGVHTLNSLRKLPYYQAKKAQAFQRRCNRKDC